MSLTRASLAAASAAELPLIPTWPYIVLKFGPRLGLYFRLNIAFSDESESDSIKNEYKQVPKHVIVH